MDDWDISDETMAALHGERITVTFNVAELAPGTYVYLDADDEVLATGALDDSDDDNDGRHRRIPPALAEFDDDDDDDMDPRGRTIVGPLLRPRTPAPRQARNDDDDDDDNLDGRTIVGPLMTPRRPAPKRK